MWLNLQKRERCHHWMEFPHFRLSGLCVLPLFPFFLWEVATFPFFAFYPIVANLPSVPRTSLEFSFCCYFFRPKPGTFSVQWNLPQLFFCFSSLVFCQSVSILFWFFLSLDCLNIFHQAHKIVCLLPHVAYPPSVPYPICPTHIFGR